MSNPNSLEKTERNPLGLTTVRRNMRKAHLRSLLWVSLHPAPFLRQGLHSLLSRKKQVSISSFPFLAFAVSLGDQFTSIDQLLCEVFKKGQSKVVVVISSLVCRRET